MRRERPADFSCWSRATPLATTFGTQGADWGWQDGGTVAIQDTAVSLTLRDLTGFEGRCDAILLTQDLEGVPPSEEPALRAWRRAVRGLPAVPTEKTGYDLVVVGGGYAGMSASIAAARLGCRVALLQDRPVLGGNGSSEVRVWAQGLIRRGEFPRLGEIVEEFADSATRSPGRAEEFGDDGKSRWFAASRISTCSSTATPGKLKRKGSASSRCGPATHAAARSTVFRGQSFADCTGHAAIGFLAGADWEMTPEKRMGMSNMWRWEEAEADVDFPATPWALDLEMDDFPYPREHHAEWFWESGFNQDPIRDAEAIRDWNLRAVVWRLSGHEESRRAGAASSRPVELDGVHGRPARITPPDG